MFLFICLLFPRGWTCMQRVGFVPRAGEAVSWQTLQEPLMTFDFNWKVLDVTLPSDEENTNYRELSVSPSVDVF